LAPNNEYTFTIDNLSYNSHGIDQEIAFSTTFTTESEDPLPNLITTTFSDVTEDSATANVSISNPEELEGNDIS
jgi:hypothetical protein